VADYRPTVSAPSKMKKSGAPLTLELEPTADIISEVTRRAAGVFVVGFAAETERVVERATDKLRAKRLDLIVANDVSQPDIGFGADVNEVTLIDRTGAVTALPRLPKRVVADRVLDRVDTLRHPASGDPSA
jgi:phosphopantothenoylcysteine decarboxylase/phosphopantothenate--cysteine ligase